ncbi:hypothetical protein B0H14DRAFT_3124822 [Mycena olivaceomarginata]|nr:hypothetical protein B0H14DRAFT_3124822 [Mycena olivaceomarginata]
MSDPAPAPAMRPPLTSTFQLATPTVSWCPLADLAPLRPRMAKFLCENPPPPPRRLPRLSLSGKPSSRFRLNVDTGTVFAARSNSNRVISSTLHFRKTTNDHIVCFITFNTNAQSLAALSGPDGEEFVKAAREVLKIDPQEEESFMWYRCSPVHRALVKQSQHYVRLVSTVSNFLAGKTGRQIDKSTSRFDLAPGLLLSRRT